jgi:mono/diheme cytochrome c family protein
MFVTTAHTTVAMNAATCAMIWRKIDPAHEDDPFPIVMALDAPDAPQRDTLPEVNGRGLVSEQTPLQHGEQVFANFRSACHGAKGENGVAKSSRNSMEALVAFIRNPTGAMPRLHPDPLNDAEVNAVATYVRTLQRP